MYLTSSTRFYCHYPITLSVACARCLCPTEKNEQTKTAEKGYETCGNRISTTRLSRVTREERERKRERETDMDRAGNRRHSYLFIFSLRSQSKEYALVAGGGGKGLRKTADENRLRRRRRYILHPRRNNTSCVRVYMNICVNAYK